MRIYVAEVLFSYSLRGEEVFFSVRAAFRDEEAAIRWGGDAPSRLEDARKQAGVVVRHLVRAEGDFWVRPMPLY